MDKQKLELVVKKDKFLTRKRVNLILLTISVLFATIIKVTNKRGYKTLINDISFGISIFFCVLLILFWAIIIFRKKNLKDKTFNIVDSISYLFLAFIIVSTIGFNFITTNKVSGTSMMPTLKDGQTLFTYSYNFEPKKDDIVIVRKKDGEYVVKRIVATPGDTIKRVDNKILVNEKPILDYHNLNNLGKPRSFSANIFDLKFMDILHSTNSISSQNIVKVDKFIILGDNLENSEDSRVYGAVDNYSIIAKVIR